MTCRIAAPGLRVVAATLGLIVWAGFAHAQQLGTGAFRQVGAIDKALQRGVSIRSDVQRVLGVPNGSGSGLFPALIEGGREIWYYEDIELTGTGKSDAGQTRMLMRQQILLVFFRGEVFDGYFWTTNSGDLTTR